MVSVEGFTQGALQLGVTLGTIILVGAILGGGIWLFLRWRKYDQYNIEWWDAKDNKTGGKDKAGIFVDGKTGNKLLFLKKNNVGLKPDNIPYKYVDGKRTVYLVRYGLKNFAYADIDVNPGPNFEIKVGEEDVNWAINAYQRSKKMFFSDKLLQLLPYIGLGVVAVAMVIIFVKFFDNFEVLKEVAAELKATAQVLADARPPPSINGTMVIS